MGVVLHNILSVVNRESRIQRNVNREVATLPAGLNYTC